MFTLYYKMNKLVHMTTYAQNYIIKLDLEQAHTANIRMQKYIEKPYILI